MSQFADGGLLASKPYIATGRYIERMSDHCRGCRFDPGERVGERACPFTTLYWDFLLRHEARFASHPRLALQVKNLARIDAAQRDAIRARAQTVRDGAFAQMPPMRGRGCTAGTEGLGLTPPAGPSRAPGAGAARRPR